MKIHQFEDKHLAHFSYVVMSDAMVAVIDPTRNPRQYEEFAMMHDARIEAIIETHPHADFISGHAELSEAKQTPIYVSSLVNAEYKHQPFENGQEIRLGHLTLRALDTPGHSPDSISVLLLTEEGTPHAVFTGDSLLIGDVGRPDLREDPDHPNTNRAHLARQMFHTTRQVLMALPDDVLVYPAHGAGSLCGKNISDAKSSTIGQEKKTNPALQPMTEEEFVEYITKDQPFVPKYFAKAVEINRRGAKNKFDAVIKRVPVLEPDHELDKDLLIIDARPAHQFMQGHLEGAINLQDGPKFETWLGSVVGPDEKFYLFAAGEDTLQDLIARIASIGYSRNVAGAFPSSPAQDQASSQLDLADFKANPSGFTVVDVRNSQEVKEKKFFEHALFIPLPELRERASEIPLDRPIVVHCASGYRSAAGTSIIDQEVKGEVPVYDLSEAVKEFS